MDDIDRVADPSAPVGEVDPRARSARDGLDALSSVHQSGAHPDPTTLGARAAAMLESLATISRDPGRLTRLFLSPEHRRAADLVRTWMAQAGAARVWEDALGTVRGEWGGRDAPKLLIGSHLDTVIDAGRFDGALGIVAGILAADYFSRQPQQLPFAIGVLAFGDEEGSRFPSTLSSSAAAVGVFDPAVLDLRDTDAVSFREALARYGKDPHAISRGALKPDEVAAYVEVHIEQGPVLEAEDLPLGVVTGIAGQSRATGKLTGEAGHAGTVPMGLRRDALAGAAEMVTALETAAQADAQSGAVATVGRLRVVPGASNVIPAEVEFSVDIRAPDDGARNSLLREWHARARAIAERRGLELSLQAALDAPATPCDPRLQASLSAAVTALGLPVRLLPSGAGHDGQMMAKLCPIGMLFVRCKGGVSHHPAEFASNADMGLAIAALIRFIADFDPSQMRAAG